MGLVILAGLYNVSFAWEAGIWDNDTTGWATTFANGDPIDAGTAHGVGLPQLAIDSNGVVYVTYDQSDGTSYHIYLSSAYPTPCTAAVAEIDPPRSTSTPRIRHSPTLSSPPSAPVTQGWIR